MLKNTELAEIKWNIITYLIFKGQTGMLDWVVDNYYVSI